MLIYLSDHFFDELLHLLNLGRDLDNLVLHLCVLQDTLRAKHSPIVLAVELDFLLGMDLAISNRCSATAGSLALLTRIARILDTHWQRR